MTKNQTHLLLQFAIEKYGTVPQMDQAVEEMAELIKALNKCKRAGIVGQHIRKPHNNTDVKTALTYFNTCSEIADVKIMIMQLEVMFDADAVNLSVERKLERLKKNLTKKMSKEFLSTLK